MVFVDISKNCVDAIIKIRIYQLKLKFFVIYEVFGKFKGQFLSNNVPTK